MADVNADKPAFEKKFTKGASADLKVNEADIVISGITEAAHGSSRHLLAEQDSSAAGAGGINVAFTVENAEDFAVAEKISASISSASSLTSLATQTGATASVAETPSFELEVEMEVATADAAGVSSKISDSSTASILATNLAAEGIPGREQPPRVTHLFARLKDAGA